jgi:hypothetical protein
MYAQRTVSIQEAVHMVANQDLVICSEKLTYLSLHQGAVHTSKKYGKKRRILSPFIETAARNFPKFQLTSISTSTFARKC